MPELLWLPHIADWRDKASALAAAKDASWPALVELANARLNYAETIRLDKIMQKRFPQPPAGLATKPVRLAVLGSSTTEHLLPGIRVGALRHGIWLSTYTGVYGQYFQELADPGSALHKFKPDIVLFAFDAEHILTFGDLDAACSRLRMLWGEAKKHFGAAVFQQTVLPVAPALLGNNEHRWPASPRHLTNRLNECLREMAETEDIHLLAIDEQAGVDGIAAWHDPAYWHRARQDITPLAVPMYGDLAARMVAALQGQSRKCLVLDLDNTLWGGVIGDDGLEGIKLGQGSAAGEAHLTVQRYASDLSRRGVILAVCSKNDEANALEPFDKHPEMILRRSDIACFVANWNDKAANLRSIAEQLNISIDSLVLVDDSPFERNIVRRELPMVAVPELPEDPALYTRTLAAAGYFEALRVTEDDRLRSEQYQSNIKRETLKASSTDIDGYLKSLNMRLEWSAFDSIGLTRIVQLINKTNQFNLTTRRYTESDIKTVMNDSHAFTAQLRLIDQFGDNGIIGAVIGIGSDEGDMVLDTWLMSCRVLGRGAEEATLNIVAGEAGSRGARSLIGDYIPSAKNGIVKDHYRKLGFGERSASADGSSRWILPLESFAPRKTYISIVRAGA